MRNLETVFYGLDLETLRVLSETHHYLATYPWIYRSRLISHVLRFLCFLKFFVCNSPPINGQCTSHRIVVYNGPLIWGFNVPVKGLIGICA